MEKVKAILRGTIRKLYGIDIELNLVLAPKEIGADFATNVAMSLAKQIKKNPLEIAEEVCEKIQKEETEITIEVAKPGFMNIKMTDDFYREELEVYEKDFLENISSREYLNKTVICEFSDPNPYQSGI